MDWINAILRAVIGGFASLFGEAHPLISLTLISIATGIGMLWVFGKTSNQQAIQQAKKKMQAYLLELRLYGDDPSLIWQSQKNLFAANLRYTGLMLKPALYLIPPTVILLFHLDAFYGMAPLPVTEPAVVTVQVNGRISAQTSAPELQAPPGVAVETPAVRALEAGQFSWRLRPMQDISGNLSFTWENHGSWEKSVAAGNHRQYLSPRRVSRWYETVWNPGEGSLDVDAVEWVEIRYPGTTIELWGLDLHWLVWFLVISLVSAYALKGYFDVAI